MAEPRLDPGTLIEGSGMWMDNEGNRRCTDESGWETKSTSDSCLIFSIASCK